MSFGFQILGFGAFPRADGAYVPSHAALFDGSADYLAVPFDENGNLQTFTFSCWIKRLSFGAIQTVFGGLASNKFYVKFDASDRLDVANENSDGSRNSQRITNSVYRDSTSWMHLVVQNDVTQSTAGDRIKLYVNGIQLSDFYGTAQLNQYEAGLGNTATTHWFGQNSSGGQDLNAMIAEAIFIDGVAYDSSVFGENDSSTGIWVPKNPIAGYGEDTQAKNISDWGGNNSFYFNFSDTNILGKNFRPTEVTANPGTYKIDYSIYFDGSSQYLDQASAFSSAPSDADKYSLSMWLKRVEPGTAETFAHSNPSTSEYEQVKFNTDDIEYQYNFNDGGGDFGFSVNTTAVYRDPTAWMHFMLRRDSGVIDTFVNGVKVATSTGAHGTATDTKHGHFNDTAGVVEFGRQNYPGGSASAYYHGYMAEVIFLDGYFAAPTDLGGWDANGVWMPVDPTSLLSSSKGTNGFALQFKGDGGSFDSSADAGGVGADTSGNNHHFRGQGNVHNNRTTMSPTNTSGDNEGNYPTMNPLNNYNSVTFKNGNLTAANSASSVTSFVTHAFRVGGSETAKVYFEMQTGDEDSGFGFIPSNSDIADGSFNLGASGGISVYGVMQEGTTRLRELDGSSNANHDVFSGSRTWNQSNDRLCCAIDLANGKMWGGFFDASEDTVEWTDGSTGYTGDPANGTNPVFTLPAGMYILGLRVYNNADNNLNFGQTAYAKTAPSGFGSYSTAKMAAPTYTDPRKYFAPVIYEGTGSALSVRGCYDSTGTAWTPDWVWIKNRDQTDDPRIFDTVRGASEYLESSSDVAQSQGNFVHGMLSDFIPGGFKVYNNVSVNTVGESYAAFCWRAGGKPTVDNTGDRTPTSGSVMKGGTAQTSSNYLATADIYPKRMSIAEHGGFSIVQYVGNGTDDQDVPHGLDTSHPDGGKPSFILGKRIDATANWVVGHDRLDVDGDGAPFTDFMNFDVNAQAYDGNTVWSDEAPSSTVFTLGSGGGMNASSGVHIAYLFQRVPGLIGVGNYTGNGGTNGPYIIIDDGATGFRPAWIMEKRTDAAGAWYITDVARNTYNPINFSFLAEGTNADVTGTSSSGAFLDATANGYKIKGTSTGQEYNIGNGKYIYVAFADQSFPLQGRAR